MKFYLDPQLGKDNRNTQCFLDTDSIRDIFTGHFNNYFILTESPDEHVDATLIPFDVGIRNLIEQPNLGLSQLFSYQTIQRLKDARQKIVLVCFTESFPENFLSTKLDEEHCFVKMIHELLENYNRTPHNTLFLLPSLKSDSAYQKWCQAQNVQPCLKYLNMNFFERDAFLRITKREGRRLEKLYNSAPSTYLPSKRFIAMAARLHLFRKVFFSEILIKDLLKYFYYSLLDRDKKQGESTILWSDFNLYSYYFSQPEKLQITQFFSGLPYKLDFLMNTSRVDQFMPLNHILGAALHVVLETDMDGYNVCFLTEKTYKPIICQQPFIIAGNPDSLASLKAKGYQTFPELFQEDYDQMTNSKKRFQSIISNIHRLCQMPENDFNQLINSPLIQEKVIHNRKNFYERNQKLSMFTDLFSALKDPSTLTVNKYGDDRVIVKDRPTF